MPTAFEPTDAPPSVVAAAERLQAVQRRTIETVIETGKELAIVRRRVRGDFGEWLRKNSPFTPSMAERYIAIWKIFGGKSPANFDLHALYALASPNVPPEAAEYALALSRRQRITFEVAREIVSAHRTPPPLLGMAAVHSKIPEATLAIEANRGLGESLKAGQSLYLTRVESDDESYCHGTLTGPNGVTKQATGETPANVLIELAGTFPKKTCTSCGLEKKIIEFVRNNDCPDGYEFRCLKCLARATSDRTKAKRLAASESIPELPADGEPPA